MRKIVQAKLKNTWTNYMNTGQCLLLKSEMQYKEGPILQTTYQFDINPKESNKTIWLHKNQSNSNGSEAEDRFAYQQPIVPVCIEDSILISVPLFDTQGNFLDYMENSQVVYKSA